MCAPHVFPPLVFQHSGCLTLSPRRLEMQILVVKAGSAVLGKYSEFELGKGKRQVCMNIRNISVGSRILFCALRKYFSVLCKTCNLNEREVVRFHTRQQCGSMDLFKVRPHCVPRREIMVRCLLVSSMSVNSVAC